MKIFIMLHHNDYVELQWNDYMWDSNTTKYG
jgi:hypothetical protein